MSSGLTLHLIGHAHLDPVWLWRWPEGFNEAKATFRSALDRMNETPGFVFTCSSAAVYDWVEENDPALFAEITRRVKEGRWVPAGGWWIESDLNIPNGESLARQGLYGQRFFREKFGFTSRVGFSPDSFGHSAALPKILAGSGFRAYLYMRPNDTENPRVPLPVFRWIADDGSEVLCFRLVWSYSAGSAEQLEFKMRKVPEIVKGTPFGDEIYIFYGVGNHGGGPTKAQLALIESRIREGSGPRLLYSSPEIFLDAAERITRSREVPVWHEGMHAHALGCLSIAHDVKAASRRAEETLLSAEMWSSVAQMLTGKSAPTAKFTRAWKDLLFNHFHDILPGSSVREAYTDARDQIGGATYVANYALTSAQSTVSWQIDTRGLKGESDPETAGTPLVVFNHQTFPFDGVIETDDIGFALYDRTPYLTDAAGAPVEHQLVKAHTVAARVRMAVRVKLPALGYAVLRLRTATKGEALPPPAVRGAVMTSPRGLANDRLELSLNSDGFLALKDLRTGKDVFSGSAGVPLVIEDRSDTWSHGVSKFGNVIGRFQLESAELLEPGPVRGRLRARYRYNDSLLRLDYLLGASDAFVTVEARVDWRERWKMLKLVFPTGLRVETATAEVPYGTTQQTTDGTEHPMQQWVDVSSGDRGVAIANDSRYAYSVVDGEIRQTILRSPPFAYDRESKIDFEADQDFMEQGVQTFKLAIIPHAGDWRAARVLEIARLLNRPPQVLADTFHAGPLPAAHGFLTCTAPGVYVTTVKRAEEDEGWIVRAAEWFGRASEGTIALIAAKREWPVTFGAGQLKSFFVPDRPEDAVKKVNLLEDR